MNTEERRRYIAFTGTYNEQVYDEDSRTVTWTQSDAKIENVRVLTEDDNGNLFKDWRRAVQDEADT